MKLLFNFDYIYNEYSVLLDSELIPRVGELVYYKGEDYIVTSVFYPVHQLGQDSKGVISKPYINLKIYSGTLKGKLCLGWRKLLCLVS
jgi:hypothetical protein